MDTQKAIANVSITFDSSQIPTQQDDPDNSAAKSIVDGYLQRLFSLSNEVWHVDTVTLNDVTRP